MVASGNREGGLRWFKEYGSLLPMLLDQDRQMYKRNGIHRQVYVSLNLKKFIRYAEEVIAGRKMPTPYPGDNGAVIGGNVIVDSTGRLVYVYRSKDQYDRPMISDLLDCLHKLEV